MDLQGGCFCGFVRYRVGGIPVHETCCHCSICRRTGAAPFVAWFTVDAGDFALLSGEPARFRSSDHATRSFCPRCGTPLAFRDDRQPNAIDVTTCSLDDPERVPPRDHTHTGAKLSWAVLGGLPTFPGARD